MAETGDPINRPPLFDSRHFSWWAKRMKAFVESVDPQLWDIIEKGPIKITTLDKNGVEVMEKPKNDWNEEDHKNHSKNAHALNILHCALTKEDFSLVSSYESAKEAWDALDLVYNGTPMLKGMRWADASRRLYSFKMNKGESIKAMMYRFLAIVDELKPLGEKIRHEDHVCLVLNGLPPKYNHIAGILSSQKNLPLNELFSKLLYYEEEYSRRNGA